MTFKILSEREHVLQRSGMYIGSSTVEPTTGFFGGEYKTINIVPGLMKIVFEIIENSCDEFVRTEGKFANKISITIENSIVGTEITVHDNGRGIPVEKMEEGWKPTLAWTRARAGSNFSDDGNIPIIKYYQNKCLISLRETIQHAILFLYVFLVKISETNRLSLLKSQ